MKSSTVNQLLLMVAAGVITAVIVNQLQKRGVMA